MNEEHSLQYLKAKMNEKQRKEMAEVISNEISRREQLKKKFNSREEMAAMYADMKQKMATNKAEAASRSRSSLISRMPRMGFPASGLPLKNIDILLLGAAVILCGAKVVTRGVNEITSETKMAAIAAAPLVTPASVVTGEIDIEGLSAEKQLLLELDSRRTELEKRKSALDTKEEELKEQGRALAERTAELKGLSTRLSQVKKERDAQYDSRMDQLANVYASMAPAEAAPLISKLDTSTALEILRRMPGKRIGQILGSVPQEKAVQLTKELTDRKLSIRD
jgi:flagellar motility protein MotE (MotC chaperone)